MVALKHTEDNYTFQDKALALDAIVLPFTTYGECDEVEMQLRTKEAEGFVLHNMVVVLNKVGQVASFTGIFFFRQADETDVNLGELDVHLIDPETGFNADEYQDADFKSRKQFAGETFYHYVVRG